MKKTLHGETPAEAELTYHESSVYAIHWCVSFDYRPALNAAGRPGEMSVSRFADGPPRFVLTLPADRAERSMGAVLGMPGTPFRNAPARYWASPVAAIPNDTLTAVS